MLVIATGSELALKTLSLDLIDFFDVIRMDYVHNFEKQKDIAFNYSSLPETSINQVIDIVNETRGHHEVERGVSTRGMIKYTELLDSLSQVEDKPEEVRLREGALVSLPHRLILRPEVDVAGKREGGVGVFVNLDRGEQQTEHDGQDQAPDQPAPVVGFDNDQGRVELPVRLSPGGRYDPPSFFDRGDVGAIGSMYGGAMAAGDIADDFLWGDRTAAFGQARTEARGGGDGQTRLRFGFFNGRLFDQGPGRLFFGDQFFISFPRQFLAGRLALGR